MDLLTKLKFNLRESSSPFFSDAELNHLLDKNNKDLNKASREGLLMKAEDDSISLPGGLQVPSNKEYWLSLARKHRTSGARSLSRGDDL